MNSKVLDGNGLEALSVAVSTELVGLVQHILRTIGQSAICSGSCTVSLEDRLALLDDEVGDSGASVTGDWRSRPKFEGDGTSDPSLLPGLVAAFE